MKAHINVRTSSLLALEILVWWALMVGVWVATLSGTTIPEIVSATAAGFLSALAAVAARRATRNRWSVDLRWLRWLPVFVASVAADTAAVFGLALRHIRSRDVHGDFNDVPLFTRTSASDDSHRAFATLTLSSTPGSVVYNADPEQHRLFVHTIVDTPPDLEGTVSR